MSHSLRSTKILTAALFVSAAFAGCAQAQDAADGEALFMQSCAICHNAAEGAMHKIGPNLWGVFGKTSGMAEGYMYSPAMAGAGLTWDEATLAEYLDSPATVVPGTKMGFPGFETDEDEANMIAYLESLQ